ncbi:uracil-DNA glycosylase [Entomoplasma freundtii]|uniref:Uracil-DNA glycosylase n=1 Tax=Entomoplasma freundtii TaxID=74700 RepID=A0A2K8NS74_9MOLU|nr:uracil-DNA glycosylase [Entomoplasma freundtii]ATZ16702.1 uracil-DNA glycosylase [Entomoplasma freundtii]TDY58131.1 uracil-DNA glycosylase [Entomoplasma freundtii]
MKILKAWEPFFLEETKKPYWKKLQNFLQEEAKEYPIYPTKEDVFRLFSLVAPQDVKVVIIGQDPYHGANQANGLAFSVYNNQIAPPSLKNIFRELKNDLGVDHPHNDLAGWARQGVFLINTALTVQAGKPGSHRNQGWEIFVKDVLDYLDSLNPKIVYALFGKSAENTYNNLNLGRHPVVVVGHPSPFSYDKYFKNSRPFSQINNLLIQEKLTPIDWTK